MHIKFTKNGPVRRKHWDIALQAMYILVAAAMLSGAQLALAAQVEDGCMQDAAGFALNCTANDVQIAGVAKNPDGTVHRSGSRWLSEPA